MSFTILFVIESLGHGGAERSLAEMLPPLTSAGIRTVVAFFNRQPQSLETLLRTQGADVRFLPQHGMARRVIALRRLIRQERPNVIHTALFKSDVIGRLASIGQDTVVVSSLVNMSYDRIRLENRDVSPLKLWGVRLIDAWTARHLTTHFHAVSEPVKTAAIEALGLPPQRITVIERGRNGRFGGPSAERRAKARFALGLNDADELVLTVGRQEYQKGHRYLLDAMSEVARHRPRAKLLVAGAQGRQSDLLEALRQRHGLSDRVQLLGHRDDVPDLLAAADLFVFPSLYEGAAGALLEAMAMGLPIVASRIPSIENAVEEGRNALLVERASIAPLAQAILEILSDRERATAFGCRSREIFVERFTLDRAAARMIEFYRAVAAQPPGSIASRATSELRCG